MPTPYEKLFPQSFPTPNVQDEVLVELVDVSKAWCGPSYTPLDYGAPYPDQANFPGYKLVFQEPVATGDGADKMARLVWAKNRLGQDAYNAYTKYVQEGANYPIYIRSDIVPRVNDSGTPYEREPDLSVLDSVVSLQLISGGNGYEGDDLGHIPLVFSGGGGTGASGYGLILPGETEIHSLYLTDGGTGYTSNPAIDFAGGAGFTGIAYIQSQTAFLVSEETKPAEGQLGTLYLARTRVFHTLPGPTLRQWLWDEQIRMFVKISKTIVASTDVPDLTHTLGTPGLVIEYQPLDKNRYVKIESSIIYASEGEPPAPHIYATGVQHYPLPNEIVGTPFIYYVWAMNENGIFDMDVGLAIDIREGYSGPYDGRVTEYYTFEPENVVIPALTVFNPQAHSFAIGWWFANSRMARAQIVNISIPQTIHGELTFDTDGDSGSATVNTVTIPATVPPSVSDLSGTYIKINFTEPRPYRYGLYIYKILEIKIPSFV